MKSRKAILKEIGEDGLMSIYHKLYEKFGPRHWWPAESVLEIIVGAVLTQSVAWKNVEKALQNLKQAEKLSFSGINHTGEEELGELIIPTLYWRMKAKKLKALFQHINLVYQDSFEKMFKKPLKELRAELLDVYGIGPETADCILLYAGEYPIFVIDAYTKRIFNRLGVFAEDIKYDEMQNYFMKNLPEDVYLFNEYHALIVALGNQVCLSRKPKCDKCPINKICTYKEKEAEV